MRRNLPSHLGDSDTLAAITFCIADTQLTIFLWINVISSILLDEPLKDVVRRDENRE